MKELIFIAKAQENEITEFIICIIVKKRRLHTCQGNTVLDFVYVVKYKKKMLNYKKTSQT